MDDLFYQLGRKAGRKLRAGRWVWSSLAGSEQEALEAEYRAGCDVAQSFDRECDLEKDTESARFVARISERLAQRLNNKQRRWRVLVTQSSEANALALPGGFIYVSRGLLDLCQHDEDEIACVVAHEMGHVVKGHAMERITNEFLTAAAANAVRPAGGLLAQWVLGTGVKLLGRAYSRDREFEADEFGARLAAAARYDPRGAIRAFERLRRLESESHIPLSQYYSTHPQLEERAARLRGLIRVGK